MARKRKTREQRKREYDNMLGPGAYDRDYPPRRGAAVKGSTAELAATSGFVAKFNGDCARCPSPIVGGASRVIVRPEGAIHVTCASGADDDQ